MLKHSQLKECIKRLNSAMDLLSIPNYSVSRDEKGYLLINMMSTGETIRFPSIELRTYQEEDQLALFVKKILRSYWIRPRRAGKEVGSWNIAVQAAIEKPGCYLLVYPTQKRGRDILWDGNFIIKETDTSIRFLDMLDHRLLAKKPNDTMMKIEFTNGSIIQICGCNNNIDYLRGMNPRGIIFSEFAYADFRVYENMLPVITQNGGWIILQSTYNGRNHAWHLMQLIKNNPDWYAREDSVLTLLDRDGNRYITDEQIELDRQSGMPEFKIQQEYYSIVELNEAIMYFSTPLKEARESGRIRNGLVMPGHSIDCFFDLGRHDATAIWFVQYEYNLINCVGYMEKSSATIQERIQVAKEFCAKYNCMLRFCFLPHDATRKSDNYSLTYEDSFRDAGLNYIIIDRPLSKQYSIDSAMEVIYSCQFDESLAADGISALSSYRKKYDQKLNIYLSEPVHDWASHGSDAFQLIALAKKSGLICSDIGRIIQRKLN